MKEYAGDQKRYVNGHVILLHGLSQDEAGIQFMAKNGRLTIASHLFESFKVAQRLCPCGQKFNSISASSDHVNEKRCADKTHQTNHLFKGKFHGASELTKLGYTQFYAPHCMICSKVLSSKADRESHYDLHCDASKLLFGCLHIPKA